MKNRHEEIIRLLSENKFMKIDDLCEKLSVSPATIRRDLTELQKSGVQRIGGGAILADPELGSERPNNGQARQIGCIVSVSHAQHNPYFSLILQGIEHGLTEHGYSLAYMHTLDDIKNETILNKVLHNQQIEGLIVIEGVTPNVYQQLKKHIPVIVGIDISDHEVSVISYDRVNAAKSAVMHLLEQGHRKIGFIGGAGLSGDLQQEKRFRGFKYALQEAGIEINPEWVMDTKWDLDTSYAQMLELLNRGTELPTAIFAASDMMAISAMRAVSERNLRIPEDIAFIGLDNIEISQYTTPPLSSVHIPKYEMGQTAAKIMIDSLQRNFALPFKLFLPYKLVLRQSSMYMRG